MLLLVVRSVILLYVAGYEATCLQCNQENNFRTRCKNTMTDRINDSKNQPLSIPRANLFYLLQQLSRKAEVKDGTRGSECPVFDEQNDAHHRRATSTLDLSVQTDVLTSGWSSDGL